MSRLRCAYKNLPAFVILLCALKPAPLAADVTVTQHLKRHGALPDETWTRKLSIKGLKMRVENLSNNGLHVSIYDLVAGKRFRLDPQRREIFVLDLKAYSDYMRGRVIPAKLARVIRPTGKKSQTLGVSCDQYIFDLQAPEIPSRIGTDGWILHDHGTACVSQDMLGGADFTNFVHEAIKRQYTVAAALCGPDPSTIGFYFYGDQPNVMVLSATTDSAYESGSLLGLGDMTLEQTKMEVTAIDPRPIPDSDFQIPADWKIKKDK